MHTDTSVLTPAVVARHLGYLADYERAARLDCGAHAAARVDIVAGASSPRLLGAGGHHTARGRDYVVTHPHLWRGPTDYHPSTLRVEVGAQWRPTVGW